LGNSVNGSQLRDMGFVKLIDNAKGYYNLTCPIDAVREGKFAAGQHFQVTYDPKDRSIKYTPKLPKKRRSG
jgi:hypothetical protein